MSRSALASFAALGLGLATVQTVMPAPALAQNTGVLPADPQDFQCFVLLQQRRNAMIANQQMQPDQRAEVVNNLTIISAYYAGRISHYSSADAVGQFQSATAEVNAASPEQRDGFANICANFYLSVMDVLVNTGQQATQPPQARPNQQ